MLGTTKTLGIFAHREFLLFRFNLGNFVPNRLPTYCYFHFESADVIFEVNTGCNFCDLQLGKTKILGIFTHQEFLLFRFNFGNFTPNRLLSSGYFHFESADVIIEVDSHNRGCNLRKSASVKEHSGVIADPGIWYLFILSFSSGHFFYAFIKILTCIFF